MQHVVVTSFGSDGDFNPVLAIAAALARRGVAVSFVANPFYAARVRRAGCRFVAAGEFFDLFAMLQANRRFLVSRSGLWDLWNELLVPSIREAYPVVRETLRDLGATVVVSHVLGYGGAWAAAQRGARSVVVTPSASVWLSRHHPLVVGNWRAPRLIQGALSVAMRRLGPFVIGSAVRQLARELGAPEIVDIVGAADLNVGVWPTWYRAAAGDDPPHAQPCGFVFDDPAAAPALDPQVEAFLATGDAPVVAAFGSAASLHGAERYFAIASACEQLGRRCLLIGRSADVVAPSPSVLSVAVAPYARVFPSACAIVHHGGFGTAAEALRAGKPTLITPFAFDQFDTAARAHDNGFGRWFRDDASDPAQVAPALDAVLREPRWAAGAAAAAARIAAQPDGAERAAQLIAAV